MSERVVALFKRLDEDVHARMAFAQADRQEALALMIGLCRRAALVGLSNIEAEGAVDRVAMEMVDLLLQLRDAMAKDRLSS